MGTVERHPLMTGKKKSINKKQCETFLTNNMDSCVYKSVSVQVCLRHHGHMTNTKFCVRCITHKMVNLDDADDHVDGDDNSEDDEEDI